MTVAVTATPEGMKDGQNDITSQAAKFGGMAPTLNVSLTVSSAGIGERYIVFDQARVTCPTFLKTNHYY
jgi:hypothetical protein